MNPRACGLVEQEWVFRKPSSRGSPAPSSGAKAQVGTEQLLPTDSCSTPPSIRLPPQILAKRLLYAGCGSRSHRLRLAISVTTVSLLHFLPLGARAGLGVGAAAWCSGKGLASGGAGLLTIWRV